MNEANQLLSYNEIYTQLRFLKKGEYSCTRGFLQELMRASIYNRKQHHSRNFASRFWVLKNDMIG